MHRVNIAPEIGVAAANAIFGDRLFQDAARLSEYLNENIAAA